MKTVKYLDIRMLHIASEYEAIHLVMYLYGQDHATGFYDDEFLNYIGCPYRTSRYYAIKGIISDYRSNKCVGEFNTFEDINNKDFAIYMEDIEAILSSSKHTNFKCRLILAYCNFMYERALYNGGFNFVFKFLSERIKCTEMGCVKIVNSLVNDFGLFKRFDCGRYISYPKPSLSMEKFEIVSFPYIYLYIGDCVNKDGELDINRISKLVISTYEIIYIHRKVYRQCWEYIVEVTNSDDKIKIDKRKSEAVDLILSAEDRLKVRGMW